MKSNAVMNTCDLCGIPAATYLGKTRCIPCVHAHGTPTPCEIDWSKARPGIEDETPWPEMDEHIGLLRNRGMNFIDIALRTGCALSRVKRVCGA